MKRKIGIFTIVQNEPAFLPVWKQYYQQHVPAADLYVLDHNSTDAKTIECASRLNRVPVHRAESFNHRWLRDVVERFQVFLLESYEFVLFTEVDEIVAPDPRFCARGLNDLLNSKEIPETGYMRCTGFEIVHKKCDGEPALQWDQPLLEQRHCCRRSEKYSKPLLASRPLEWSLGFHRLRTPDLKMCQPDPELLLLHLHRVDYDTCRAKTLENASRRWSIDDLKTGAGYQNAIVDDEEFDRWFYTDFHDELHDMESIPQAWKGIV